MLWVVPATIALVFLTAVPAFSAAVPAKVPHLGAPMTAEDVAKWDITIFPDGRGLPEGHGTAADGKVIYDKQCATCHGEGGRGGTAEELITEGGALTDEAASKAIGPYWPFATTVFDFVRRSMPPNAPGSLTPDQLYEFVSFQLFIMNFSFFLWLMFIN